MLPIAPETVRDELGLAKKLIDKWAERFESLPGIDTPSANATEVLGRMLQEFCGELRVLSGKCDTLADVFENFLG